MALSRTRLLMMGVGDPASCAFLSNRTRVLSSRRSVGDPGFLSALKSIGGAALSFVPGGGAARLAISKAGSMLSRPPILSATGRPMAMAPQTSLVNRALNLLPNITPAQARAGGLGIAGAALSAAGLGAVLGRPSAAAPAAGAATFFGGRRRRRMRATNIRALGRATRRLASFHKLAVHTEQQLSHLVRRRTRRAAFGRKNK